MNQFETTITGLRKNTAVGLPQAPLIHQFCAATVKKGAGSKPRRSLIQTFDGESGSIYLDETKKGADETRVQGFSSPQVEVSTLYELIKQTEQLQTFDRIKEEECEEDTEAADQEPGPQPPRAGAITTATTIKPGGRGFPSRIQSCQNIKRVFNGPGPLTLGSKLNRGDNINSSKQPVRHESSMFSLQLMQLAQESRQQQLSADQQSRRKRLDSSTIIEDEAVLKRLATIQTQTTAQYTQPTTLQTEEDEESVSNQSQASQTEWIADSFLSSAGNHVSCLQLSGQVRSNDNAQCARPGLDLLANTPDKETPSSGKERPSSPVLFRGDESGACYKKKATAKF